MSNNAEGKTSWRDEARQEWGTALRFLVRRVVTPTARPGVMAYLGIAVVLIGGLGVWIGLGWLYLREWRVVTSGEPHELLFSLLLSVVTYAFALFGSAFLDASLDPDLERAGRVPLLFAHLILLVVGGVFTALWWRDSGPVRSGPAPLVFSWGWFLLTLLACWGMWWIANGSDRKFMLKPPDPSAAAGGDPTKSLTP